MMTKKNARAGIPNCPPDIVVRDRRLCPENKKSLRPLLQGEDFLVPLDTTLYRTVVDF
jgi:hypothetical protein